MLRIHPYYFSKQKRFFDVVLALGLMILTGPLLVIIAGLVVITAGWPIFFLQKRAGQHKKPFVMIKFRTMYVGADKHQRRFKAQNQAPTPMFKIFDDPRFVGIGHWLSRTGLDELPQLINIVRGEMSLVGPRPLPMNEARQLKSNWDFRFQVRPGVFSEWTLDPERHKSLRIWQKLDERTISKGSLLADVTVIVKTLFRK